MTAIDNAIYSMTGYGKGIAEQDGLKVTVELKSVNHRFLDLNIKLPKVFTFAEDILRKTIQGAISRGHIDVYVNYEDTRESKKTLSIDYDLAEQYMLASKQLQEKGIAQNNLFTAELLRMPDVVTQVAKEEDEELLVNLLKSACVGAIENINAMKLREGSMLVKDLYVKIKNIQTTIPKIQELAPKTLQEYRTKLEERVKEYLKDAPIDEVKLINEIAFYSDKFCTDEEVTRLYTHIDHFKSVLDEGGAVGKKLDFIVQEMNRETNTIGSKCNNALITECVVYMKSEIEKIREQIQNLV
ncbi:MAG: YicC family protein [Clostridia bacterium]|nr:YicC family protein [Clostridia bacterium]MDE6471637.1 YicC family protein [Clostridia bacterium]